MRFQMPPRDQRLQTGTAEVRRSRDSVASRDEYLLRAAELNGAAQVENDYADKREFENLARAYLRLAKHAERNSQMDIGLRRRRPKRSVTLNSDCILVPRQR